LEDLDIANRKVAILESLNPRGRETIETSICRENKLGWTDVISLVYIALEIAVHHVLYSVSIVRTCTLPRMV
jgi:hypothetical protein